MKVLVTDFDGTLCITHSDEIDVASNICALKRFKKDNIIVLSTARKPESIMKYIKLYDIPCDYVISYLGALIWDCRAQEYIFENYFAKDIAEMILTLVNPYLSNCELQIYSNVENPTINQHIGYIFHNKEGAHNDVFYRMEENFGQTIESIIDVNYKEYDFFTRFFSEEYYFINNTKNTKLDALNFLRQYLINKSKIDEDTTIYTVGDSLDDYEMLKHYNGYRMEKSDERLQTRYPKKVSSVKELVDMII